MEDIADKNVTLVDSENSIDSDCHQMSNDDDDSSTCLCNNAGNCQLSYEQLVTDLIRTHPNPKNGHFESLANALYCEECRMVLHPMYVASTPCKVQNFVVQQDGTVVCAHAKCEKLNALEYIRSAAVETGSLKRTYWRAWSECHFLTCATCEWRYPVRNSAMCRYHPEKPKYSPVEHTDMEQPTGHYPCCGEIVFRFELVKRPTGCEFRLHVPALKNECDQRIEEIMRKHPKWIIADPPPFTNCKKKTTDLDGSDTDMKTLSNQRWWTQMKLGGVYTHRPIILLIDPINGQQKTKKLNKRFKKNMLKLHKRMVLERMDLNSNVHEEDEINPTPSDSACEITESRKKRQSLRKNLSLISYIQDTQREYEDSMFFEKLLEHRDNTTKKVKSLPGTLEQPSDKYTAIYGNILTTINDQHKKYTSTKTNKSSMNR